VSTPPRALSGIEKLLQALVESKANFIVVGAYAAILQGSSVRTDDLDVCYERTPDNYKKIAKAIAPFHPVLRGLPDNLKAPFDAHSLAHGTNFTLTTDIGMLDLLGELSGVGGYRQLSQNAKAIKFGDIVCRVAALDDVIRSKEAADRPKDRIVLPELRALQLMKDSEKKDDG
jgi:hypothetical protein